MSENCKRCGKPPGGWSRDNTRCHCAVPAVGPLEDRLVAARKLDAMAKEARLASQRKNRVYTEPRHQVRGWHPSHQRQVLLPEYDGSKPEGWPA